jgi:hypothetical protein
LKNIDPLRAVLALAIVSMIVAMVGISGDGRVFMAGVVGLLFSIVAAIVAACRQ